MTDEVGSVRFMSYFGDKAVYVAADRVLVIEQGGCGSRGMATHIRFGPGMTVTVQGDIEEVRKRIDAARSHG